ncbi:MAG: hypothetical protein KDD58_07215 [Bdellovibrionales bacterium]|nr:hypothetical protein [Bdellovibrionales bacterium]
MKTGILIFIISLFIINPIAFASGNTTETLTQEELNNLSLAPIAPKDFNGVETESYAVFTPSDSEKQILRKKYLAKKKELLKRKLAKTKKHKKSYKKSHRKVASLKSKAKLSKKKKWKKPVKYKTAKKSIKDRKLAKK